MRMINVGFGNMVAAGRIIAAVSPDSAPVRRMVQDARENKTLVDATAGRRMRTVLVMDSGTLVLSALQPETVAGRVQEGENAR